MDKKDAKKFEELYSKEDAHAMKTFEEIESELQISRNFYINELSEERKKTNFEDEYRSIFQLNAFEKSFAEQFIRDTDLGSFSYYSRSWILTSGMYLAYKNNNMSILKNCLHTMNRLTYGSTLSTCSGHNHSGSFEKVIYALADCDIDLVKKYLPKVHGLADNKTAPFFRPSCNMIMGLIYENTEWVEEARAQSIKFCGQKSSAKNDVLVVKYLLALSEPNVQNASALLQEIANNYRKTTWLFNFKNEFLKFFGVYIHGLYYLAHFVLSQNDFNRLIIPEHSVFWKEFDLFTKSVNFSKGNLMLNLDGNLKTVKRLFDE
ncbi:MAG: hypothetical protein FWF95_02295 [Syntrophorhabdaceae bacterium]|nr:hypothetical protein [Syntrophorhabdaceae bacterium]